jgi:hypothetical protein
MYSVSYEANSIHAFFTTVKDECKCKMFENRVVMKIFGPKSIGYWWESQRERDN